MTVKLKWRAEDLTFAASCRERAAVEIEATWGLSSNRHKLSQEFTLENSTLPRSYNDSDQSRGESAFGVAKASELVANKWYSVDLVFDGSLGNNEFLDLVASRGYRWSPCALGDALCVAGWTKKDQYGPDKKLYLLDHQNVKAGKTYSWNFKPRSSILNTVLRHPQDHDAYLLGADGVKHWISDGGTYNCLVAAGWRVTNDFAGLDQRWVINSFPQGGNATCSSGNAPVPTPVPPEVDPAPNPDPSGPTGPQVATLSQGPAAPAGYRYRVVLTGFPSHASVSISCHDSVDPSGFYTFSLGTDGAGAASTESFCYSGDGPDHWVIANGVESNHVQWGGGVPPPSSPPPAARVWPEQQGSLGANSFTNPYNASGMGPRVAAYQWVDIACKVYAPQIVSANPDGYWYRIASAPWSNAYYVVANTFWNGDVPGQRPYTHNTDWAVPDC